jgi:DNA-binding response OmpR family regulator
MKRILVIEDDPHIARALVVRLEASHYEVDVANDVTLGLNLLVRNQPDLVLLDILLPSGNGFTLIERARELAQPFPPIIVMTASKAPGLREKAGQLKAAAFFEKPFEAEVLLAAMRTALNESSVLPSAPSPHDEPHPETQAHHSLKTLELPINSRGAS